MSGAHADSKNIDRFLFRRIYNRYCPAAVVANKEIFTILGEYFKK
jgi:hypothetical protein